VTFDVILDQHCTYVQKLAHSAQCQVIFDGYSTSIKDHEHTRRSEGKTHCNVLVQLDTVNKYDRDKFFLNTENKARFIGLLADRLRRDGHTVTTCPGDADVHHYCQGGSAFNAENGSVDVVCTDTDIFKPFPDRSRVRTSGSIVFRKEPQRHNPKTGGRYSVEDICESLHPAQTEALLSLHCWSGCDTTSGFYGHGKLELFKKVNRSAKLQKIARQMGESNSSDDIGQLGVQLTSFQYGDGDFGADLSGLRYSKFCEIVAKCSKFDPRVLPPTPRAIHFHSLRCHLQLVRWKHLDDSLLDETEWGWTKSRNGFEPMPTDMAVAPASVLNFIRCKCKKNWKTNAETISAVAESMA